MSDESLPPGWAQIEIEDCLLPYPNGKRIRQGWSPQCEDHPAQSRDEWAVLRTSAIQDGRFVEAENKKLPASLEPRPHLEVQAGDILITCAGPRSRCGVTCLVRATRPRLLISGKMYQLRADPDMIERDFLELFLRESGTRKKIDEMKTGISDSGLNLTHDRFRTLTIPLPPLAEQKRIVAKIEELFSELEAGEESLRAARRQLGVYRQSLLKQAFEGKLTENWRTQNPDKLEWRECALSTVVDFTSGFAFKSAEYADAGVPVVRISDVSEHGVSLANTVKIAAQPEFEKFRLQKGDILIAMSGATTGKFGELKSDEKCYLNQRVGCFRTRDERQFAQRFLHHLLHGLKRKIAKDAYGGAQPNISGKQMNAYSVPCPSPAEQQEIVRLLDAQFEVIEQNEREIDAALKRSEALRQAILKKAFTGQLVPQDPADAPASALLARLRAQPTDRAANVGRRKPKATRV